MSSWALGELLAKREEKRIVAMSKHGSEAPIGEPFVAQSHNTPFTSDFNMLLRSCRNLTMPACEMPSQWRHENRWSSVSIV